MKTLATILFSVWFACGTYAQVLAPLAAQNAFKHKFPAAQSVEWEAEEPGVFETDFKMNGQKMSAAFDENGKWLETETTIKKSDLPEAVKNGIAREFAGYEIDEVEKVETPDGLAYEVELEKEENGKEVEVEALFAADGKLLKKMTEDGQDEDDE